MLVDDRVVKVPALGSVLKPVELSAHLRTLLIVSAWRASL